MYKKIASLLAAFFVIAGVLCFFFWNTLTKVAVEHYLHVASKQQFNATLTYKNLVYVDGYWLIEELNLSRGNQLWVTSPTVRLHYQIELLKRNLNIELTLVHPTISIGPTTIESLSNPSLPSTTSEFLPKLGVFSVTAKAVVDEGTLKFYNSPQDAFNFQLKGDWSSSPNFYLRTWKKNGYTLTNQASIIFTANPEQQTIEAEVKAFDCAVASRILETLWPSLHNWQATEGVISGRIVDTWRANYERIVNGDIKLQQMHWENPTLDLQGIVPFAQLILHDNGGELKFPKPLSFSIANASDEGIIATLSGGVLLNPRQPLVFSLEGECFFKGRLFPLNVQGKLNNSSEFIAENIAQLKLETQYQDLPVTLSLSASGIPSGIHFDGAITSFSDLLSFAGDFELTSDARVVKGEWVPWILGTREISLIKGSFKGSNLPIAHYGELLHSFPYQMTGFIDIAGDFDLNSLVAYYNVHDFSLNHSLFSITFPTLQSELHSPLPAVHYFDFLSGSHGGVLPLQQLSFVDKKNDMLISDVAGQVYLNKNGFALHNGAAYCEGLYLGGDMSLHWPLQDAYELNLHLHTLSGKLSQLNNFISKLNDKDQPLLHLPLEGEIELQQEGATLQIIASASPETEPLINAHLQGALIEGRVESHYPYLSLQQLNCNFEYDYREHCLAITDLQGALLVGSPRHAEEYLFTGDYVRFDDLHRNAAEFDLWIGDKNRDIVRLAGKMEPILESDSLCECSLDHTLSHFGDMHPTQFQLVLRDWFYVAEAEVKFQFQLNSLLRDLQSFSKTGLLGLSRHFLNELQSLQTASGLFDVSMSYSDLNALFSYQIIGKEISVKDMQFTEFHFNGSKKDNAWIIDQLQLDDITIAAELAHQNTHWNINFLGLQVGDALLLGLKGEYIPSSQTLQAEINLLETRLEKLGAFSLLEPFCKLCVPKGILKAQGNATIVRSEDNTRWIADLNLQTTWLDWELRGMPLQDMSDVNFHLISNKGITIEGLKSGLRARNQELLATFELKHFEHDFQRHQTVISGLSFHIPQQNTKQIGELLKDKIPQTSLTTIITLSSYLGNSLQGTLDLTATSHHHIINLELDPGMYSIAGNDYRISKFRLELDPLEMRLSTSCHYQDQPWSVEIRKAFSELEPGSLVCHTTATTPLEIYWHRNVNQEIVIQKIEGRCPGIEAHLLGTNVQELVGTIAVALPNAASVLPTLFTTFVQKWNIGGQYELSGKWTYKNPFMENVSFVGTLESQDAKVNGYQISNLNTQLKISPEEISLIDLELHDNAGSLAAKQADIKLGKEGEWVLSIPEISGSQLRPSLLRMTNGTLEPPESTFVVRKLEIKDLTGNLLNPKSFTGHGVAYCANPSKRDLPNQVWKLTPEMIENSGLNPSLVCPVSGIVYGHIQDGKIFLEKFKEMYSAGKLSKFYLPKNPKNPIYIDFMGNLHLEVRMKQYNLFMKFAESFVISIDGTTQKPIYQLKKNSDKDEDDT